MPNWERLPLKAGSILPMCIEDGTACSLMSLASSHASVTVLIADDSAFMRAALSRMVASDDSLCVVGTAQTGLETLAQIDALQPDVVTLDIDMPGMDGLETLRRVMSESPRPVIIVSSTARRGAEATLEALQLGAFDCVAKQLSYDAVDVFKVQEELISKIKAAAGPRIKTERRLARDSSETRNYTSPLVSIADSQPGSELPLLNAFPAKPAVVPSIIAIGTSTGGPKALQEILSALPADLPVAILVVQHMPVGFIGPLAKRLNDLCRLKVCEAEEGNVVTAGRVYLAPAGKHLTVRRQSSSDCALHLSPLPETLNVPSVDVMMSSVADVFGAAAMGIILTGMGTDGALGMQAIFREGGLTLGQDQESCVVYGMPRSCAEIGVLSQVVSLADLPLHILTALRYRKPH